jgi:hypothetical protein
MKTSNAHQADTLDKRPVFHGSYVLRLWSTEGEHPHGYLLDSRSGIRHPLHDLRELPALVHSIIARATDEQLKTEDSRADQP